MNILEVKNIKEYVIRFGNREDGLGGQYHGYLSLMAFCEYHDLNFKHTHFSKIGKYWKNGGIKPLDGNDKIVSYSKNEMSEINTFFGFPNEEESYEKKVLYFPFVFEVFNNPDKYFNPSFLSKIRNYYHSSIKPNIEFEKYIVIHIRRGDVSSTEKIDRFTPNSCYSKIIEYFLGMYKHHCIHIVSNGNEDEFKDIKNGDKIIYHLNKDIFFTYHLMVMADILVPAISSFSVSAALLNTNKIYYIGNQIVPLSWTSLREII